MTVKEINNWLLFNRRTVAWLARLSDVSQPHIFRCLKGQCKFGSKALNKIIPIMKKFGRRGIEGETDHV